MTLRNLGLALKKVVPNCFHYAATKQPDKYIVWAEDIQAESFWADSKMTLQAIQGTVHYFTRDEYDSNFGKIQSALNTLGISWRLNSIQYEDDTRYIHYEWVWEMEVSVDGEDGD